MTATFQPTTSAPPPANEQRTDPGQGMKIVRPDRQTLSRQQVPYFVGVSAASAGARCLSMNLVVIPPHGAAAPHSHRGFESAVYMLEGRVNVRYGAHLDERLTLEQGDFLFIPADMPHQPINNGDTPALALVARNDANEQEHVELFNVGGAATSSSTAVAGQPEC